MTSPVFNFDAENPSMVNAVERARATFKYFWREIYWEGRRIVPGLDMYMVKVAFTDGPRDDGYPDVEQMWVGDLDFDGTNLYGVLVNTPNWLTSVKEGDAISVPFSQVTDWILVALGKAYGAFTVHAIREGMKPKERIAHDEAWGLDFGDFNNVRFILDYSNPAPASSPKKGMLGGLFGSKASAPVEPKHEMPSKFEDHAMCKNLLPQVKDFIEKNPESVHEADQIGLTLLHREALAGNAGIVKLLLQNKANPFAKTPNGDTPASLARKIGWNEIAAGLERLSNK